ncbi:MFS transporter [Spirillospora sp. CA-294931]|uniref:MFS transporter n=1 Tax=Spirillospora sp. CA-294931 TaxID=3240042 RepID=UPI003D8A54F9
MTTVLEPVPETPQEKTTEGLLSRRYRGPTFGITFLVTLLGFEAMAVGTVMPIVARDLNGLALYAWGFSATLIASLLATVLAGGWIDRVGSPIRPLVVGLAVFLAGLVISGAAPTMETFVAGRAVQGLGTGLALVSLYVVIARVYPEELRPRVFAAEAIAWIMPSLLGPAVGGLVAEHIGWRWVFLGLVPLVIPPALLLVPALRKLRPAEASAAKPKRHVPAIALTAGAAIMLFGLERHNWTLLPIAALGLAGLAYGLPKLLPAGTLRMRRGLPSVVLTRGLLSGAFVGTDIFIPLALTSQHGFSATKAGIVLTVAALGWSIASQFQGRSKRPRTFFVRLGAILMATGVLGVAVTLHLSAWATAPAWLIGGAGMGLAVSSLSVLLLDQSPESEQGVNSSSLAISDMLGASLLAGMGGALITAFGTDHLTTGLTAAGALFTAVAVLAALTATRLTPRPQTTP